MALYGEEAKPMGDILIITAYIALQSLVIFAFLFWVLPHICKRGIENRAFQQTLAFKQMERFVMWLNTKIKKLQ